ncbi:TadE/TadG family type IV pilus assembly protein [Actinobacillus delphinicola]|uniref:Tight adherence protein E n=1 Tax=Actinobacillus delphinicola TaxID=51161 RepID=A0A448TW90_9PAST|nr:TadE/TadG family type IV pilus assembly protein [Actinobacillus delphinicola]VEJ10194.1 tight adherence protein E [Actinobacillus delphinicola]
MQLLQRISQFKRQQKGVASIEFGLTIGVYLLVIFMIFEMGRIAITNAYWDLAVTEAVRITKNQDLRSSGGDYAQVLKQQIVRQYNRYSDSTVMGIFAAKLQPPAVTVNYADNMQDLLKAVANPKGQGFTNNSRNAPLARYLITYNYHFMFGLPFLNNPVNQLFTRQFFVVQEYERSDFN